MDSVQAELTFGHLRYCFKYVPPGPNAYLAMEVEPANVGMKINEQKTKYMIATVAFGDRKFEVVNEFVYLGALLTPQNEVGFEIQRRIQTANRCLCDLCGHLIWHVRQS
jgi:hypothetical protein